MTDVIELGEDHGIVDDSLLIVPARRLRRDRRIARVAFLGVAVALVISSAVAPVASTLSVLATVSVSGDSQLLATGNQLFVADGGSRRLASYPLPSIDGKASKAPRWSVPLDMSADGIEIRDGVLVVERWTGVSRGAHLEVFDPRTGTVLWVSSNVAADFDVEAGTLLLVGADGRDVQLVDVRTGVALWGKQMSADCEPTFATTDPTVDVSEGATPNRLVEACALTSTLRTFDLVSGAQIASRHVPLGTPAAPIPLSWQPSISVTSVSNTVITAHSASPEPVLDGYDTDTLRTLWSGRPDPPTGGMYGCGTALCLDIGAIEEVIDVHTGSLIRIRTEEQAHEAAAPAAPSPPTIALVPDPTKVPTTKSQQSDATVVSTPTGLSAEAPTFHGTSVNWVAVMSFTGAAPGDVALRGIEPLQGASPDSCVTEPGVLACATSPGTLTLWRLPAGLG